MTDARPTKPGAPPARGDRAETLALAAVFGVASVPWTYAFVAWLPLPLWPSFVASAAVFAAGGGRRGLARALAGTLAGVAYATATLAVVEGPLGGGTLALALVVGAFMLLASLHPAVPVLSFAPAAFLGFAATFGVHAAGTSLLSGGLAAVAVATAASMGIGAAIGYGADRASDALA